MALDNVKLTPRQEKVQDRLRSMYNSMVDEKDQIQSLLDEVAEYWRPNRLASYFSDGYNLANGSRIYNGEPIIAKKRLSSGLFAWLISPSLDWLQYEPSMIKDEAQMKIARTYADECERYTYDTLRETNFYEQMAVAIDELVTCGTEAMMAEPNDEAGVTHFEASTINEFLTSDNRFRVSDTIIHRVKLRNRNLLAMFSDKFTKEERESFAKNPEEYAEVLHFMYPAVPGDKFYNVHPIASCYMLGGSKAARSLSRTPTMKLLEEKGMEFQQFTVAKYEEIPGHSYGNAPTFDALYEAKMGNAMSKDMEDASQLAAHPPAIADIGLKGSLKLGPRGITYRERPSDQVTPVCTNANYQIGMDALERNSRLLDKHFKSDFFMAISGIQNSSRERTRAEIMAIQAEGAAALSETVGSINRLLIEPTLVMFMKIEQSRGRWPEAPESLDPATKFTIRFKGPLAQAQRKYVNQQNTIAPLVAASQFATIDRNVPRKFDYIGAAEETAREGGLPEKFIFSDKQVADGIRAEQEQQMAMQQAAQQNEMIKNMPAAATAPEPGSYLEKMLAEKLGG